MPTSTFLEQPRRGAARLVHVLSTAFFAVAAGSGAGFLVLAFAGVAGVELAPGIWGEGDVDRMLRAGVGAAALSIVAALGLGAILLSIARLLHVRQLARDAEAAPATIASWETRKDVALESPFGPLKTFAAIFLPIDAIVILVVSLALGESIGRADDADEGFVLLGALVGAAAFVIVLLVVASRWWAPMWRSAAAGVRRAWSPEQQKAARDADRAAAHPGPASSTGALPADLRRIATLAGRIAGIAGAVGAITFFIGLAARQPCRDCDQLSYPEVGERAIDVLMAIAALVTALAVAVLVLSLVTAWLAGVIEQRALVSLAASGAGAPAPVVLAARLTGPWSGTEAGAALVGLGAGLLPIVGTAVAVAPGFWPSWVVPALAVLGVLGLVVLWWAEGGSARVRNRLREAWHPGDVVAPEPVSRKPRPEE